ncbi:nuclear transport factor 2 family protein [Spirosoma arcticum]
MKGFPGGGQHVGIDAIFEQAFSYLRANWTGWKAITTRLIDTGDGVFVIGYYEGTYTATGNFMKADFASEYKVANGKITEFTRTGGPAVHRHFFDRSGDGVDNRF